MNSKEENILSEYESLKPSLREWGQYVDNTLINILLQDMIQHESIKIKPNYRLKDNKSYLFKSLYRKKNYPNPIENIEDKIGTRIVVLKSSDIEIVKNLIFNYKNWTAILTKDLYQEIADKPTIFDYQSVHIVVRPNDGDTKYSEENIKKLTCEIQIRTLLQHAFAEISHDSTYKGPYKNDKEILRKLAKTMALMEATDDYFCDIFNIMSDDKRYYAAFLNQLTTLFSTFNNTYKSNELDQFITDSIFELLEDHEVDHNSLEAFCAKHETDLRKWIIPTNGLIFQQPIIILIFFYFINEHTFLRDNWPLELSILKDIYRVTGTSYDSY